MSTQHPSSDLLKKFAEAQIDGAISSVVSAHTEHCSLCLRALRGLELQLSSQVFNADSQMSTTQLDDAWKKISSRLTADTDATKNLDIQSELQLDGCKFVLPKALRQWCKVPLKWVAFGKGGKICKVGDEKGRSLFLIYLAANEEVPLHSHAGHEHSYVISGRYSADGVDYNTGDFSCSAEDVTHAPKAGSDGGCLLLSSVETRLNFFHGLLSPLNGPLWWVLSLRLR